MARVIAIGDIHGCSMALASILRAVRPSKDDTLVVLGDTIDNGLDSRGVLGCSLNLKGAVGSLCFSATTKR
jgi:serine/threonine protein phosphatase 1